MSDTAVVISSFDRYSPCWLPVAHGLRKYWPDCPYPIYLISNVKDFQYPGVSVIKTGDDCGWSDQLLKALSLLDFEYILYLQEDYWLTKSVNSARVEEYVEHMAREGFNYVRFLAVPPPAYEFPTDPRLGYIGREDDYRTSLQIALWRREVLRDLLVPGESPWQFEVNGTRRSRRYGDTFLSVTSHGQDPHYWGLHYLCTAINAGRWSRGAKAYARDEGLEVDFTTLPSETRWHEVQRTSWGRRLQTWRYRLGLLARNRKSFLQKLAQRLSDPRRS